MKRVWILESTINPPHGLMYRTLSILRAWLPFGLGVVARTEKAWLCCLPDSRSVMVMVALEVLMSTLCHDSHPSCGKNLCVSWLARVTLMAILASHGAA